MAKINALLVAGFTGLLLTPAAPAQGLVMSTAGAMHASMAGASTAVGTDALGSLYWNPAAISGLRKNEVVIGSELILPDIRLASTFGGQAGETRSDSGLVPTTSAGLVYRGEDSKLTIGLGVATLAAGGVNYPGDVNNPVLAPVGPIAGQFILGPQAASILVLAIEPTASYQLTEDLAVGFGPMIDVSIVSFDPAFFGPTSQTGLLAPRQFPTGSHSRPFWGGGFRTGATYRVTEAITAGVSYTSPQWFETWVFNARDALGNPLTFSTGFSLPQIVSAGVAYQREKLLVAADVRWFDYRSTALLGQPVVQGGANWDNVWAIALGTQYRLSERLAVQAGYLYNQNPVPSQQAFFNAQLPLINQHTLSVGAHFQWNEWLGMSAAYIHGFDTSLTGSLLPVLGASTTLKSEIDAFALNVHVTFGPSGCKTEACGTASAQP